MNVSITPALCRILAAASILFSASVRAASLPSFGPPVPLPVPSAKNERFVFADFDGDGIQDVARLDSVGKAVTIFLGTAAGGFRPPRVVDVGAPPTDLVAADLNRDGKPDLAVVTTALNDGFSSGLVVLLGDGTGSFSPPRVVAGGGLKTVFYAVFSGDFDGDGLPDLGVATTSPDFPGSDRIVTYHGDGTGQFRPDSFVPLGQTVVAVAVGDLNGDRASDIVAVVTPPFPGGLAVLLSDGRGGFQPPVSYVSGTLASAVALGDLDGDGVPDVAVAGADGSGRGFLLVLAGKAGGALGDAVRYSTGTGTSAVALADVNGDGALDLVTADPGSSEVSILVGDGRGTLAPRIPFGTGAACSTLRVLDLDRDGRPDLVVSGASTPQPSVLLNTSSASMGTATLFIPIVLTSSGAQGSVFSSEMRLVNRGGATAAVRLDYTSAFDGARGTATTTLADGRDLFTPSAVDYLRSLGLPLPESGNRGGTLRIQFSGLASPSDAAGLVRTTTVAPLPRAGLSYPALPLEAALAETSYLLWVTQTASDRSNVALLNVGADEDGDVGLRVTVFSTDPEHPGAATLPDVRLAPGGFTQINGVLPASGLSASRGFVQVERISGGARYFTYAVVNDQVTSDGSFEAPVATSLLTGARELVLPVLTEAGGFSSELVVTNVSTAERTIRFSFAADAVQDPSGAATFTATVAAGGQLHIPDFVQTLRDQGVAGVGPAGPAYSGALYATAEDDGSLDGILVGARTSTPGGGGRYGTFYAAARTDRIAARTAWLYGLVQDAGNRTNLALVNAASVTSDTGTFRVDLFDAETGALAATFPLALGPRRWLQVNRVLATRAPGLESAYARITRTGGTGPFLAYAVVNDGAVNGQGTGDGSFVEMRVDPGE